MASEGNDSLVGSLAKLNAFVERSGEVVFDPLRPYSVCVKFAFGRAFRFATLAAGQDPATAFFIVPALRAVTEDLILFRFLDKTGTPEERDMVIRNLNLVDVHERLDHQSRFFSRFRPFQPVLPPLADSAQRIEAAEREGGNVGGSEATVGHRVRWRRGRTRPCFASTARDIECRRCRGGRCAQ